MRHTRLQKRAIKFSEAAEWIKARYEGASSSVRRDLAIGRLKVFCLSFAVALESCTEQTKKAYAATFERYKSACARAATDPDSAGDASGRKLGHQADWLTEIIKGIAVCYACRFGSCRWFGLNHMWIADAKQAHFRCPHCFLEYFAWTGKKGQLPYQKAVHIVTPDGTVTSFPVKWPGSHEDSFLLQCAEAYAADLKTDQDLEEFASDSIWRLETMVNRIKVCEGMIKYEWDSSKEYMLDSGRWPADGTFGWKRLTDGFHGNILPDTQKGPDGTIIPIDWTNYVFVEWSELVASLGACIYAGKRFVTEG